MSTTKTYTQAANTSRAAKGQLAKQLGLTAKEVVKGEHFQVKPVDGGFVWRPIIKKVKVARRTVAAPVAGEFTHCPECKIDLGNGISDYETQQIIAKEQKAPEAAIAREFICLACDHEFGDVVKAAAPKTEGIKIQKDREERNGIKRPSVGGKCALLWEIFEKHHKETGMILTPKPAKELSAKEGLDPTTTTVQLYRWRDFMGV